MRAYELLFVTGMSVAVPVSAQFYRSPAPVPRAPVLTTAPVAYGTVPQIRDIYSDIREGAQSGQLSHKQAKELRREAGEIGLLEQRYAEGGLSDSEGAEIRTRAEVLRSIVNAKRSHVIK